ncbi:MAG: hypothetical protein EBZ69_01555 [Alphaproteobacteria bacterium]|nr:hypothetical protein [Alphaproteobacteria bacterium]
MATLITISTASINYTSGTTDCQCSIQAEVPTIGVTYFGRQVSLASGSLPPDWSDQQLCAAVAEALAVPVADVTVAGGFHEAATKAAAKAAKAAAPTDAEGAE